MPRPHSCSLVFLISLSNQFPMKATLSLADGKGSQVNHKSINWTQVKNPCFKIPSLDFCFPVPYKKLRSCSSILMRSKKLNKLKSQQLGDLIQKLFVLCFWAQGTREEIDNVCFIFCYDFTFLTNLCLKQTSHSVYLSSF